MTGNYYMPASDPAKSLINKAPEDDFEKPALMSASGAPASEGTTYPQPRPYPPTPQSQAVKDDVMLDWGYAAALAALLAVVLLREFFLFVPVLGSMIWYTPFVVLLGVPGVILGTCMAILCFMAFLWFVGIMGLWAIKILTGIMFAIQLSASIHYFSAFLSTSSTKDELQGMQAAGLPPMLQGSSQAIKEFAESSFLGAAVVSLAYAVLFGIILLGLHNKYTQATVGFLSDAKTFLVSRSQALLLSVALLCHAALFVIVLLIAPLGVAMVQKCMPDTNQMDHPSLPDTPNGFANDPSGTTPPDPQETHQDPFGSLAASSSAVMSNPTCQPYMHALLPGWISGIIFGVLSVFLLTWLTNLLFHIVVFVSATLGSEDKAALALPGGNSSAASHGMVDAKHVQSAVKRCFSRSFGSLCFSSLIATLLSYAVLLVRALFFIPGVSLLAPAFDLVGAVSIVAVQVLLSGYVLPAMAILEIPLLESARRACDLVLDNLPQVLVLEVSMFTINTVFAVLSLVCFSIPMVVIFLLTTLMGMFGIVSFEVALIGCIASSFALGIVFHSVVCAKFVALALEGKLTNGAELSSLVVSEPPSGKNYPSSDV